MRDILEGISTAVALVVTIVFVAIAALFCIAVVITEALCVFLGLTLIVAGWCVNWRVSIAGAFLFIVGTIALFGAFNDL